MKREQFLVSITTTDGSGWKAKIKEIKELGLKKAAIFPTRLGRTQRQEMYKLLEKSGLKEIPFVHIRGDMSHQELDYLIKKYNTKAFNMHTAKEFPVFYDYAKYKDKLFVENAMYIFDDEESMKNFAGLCLDFSHLENDKRLHKERYKESLEMSKKYPIGCNHISAVPDSAHKDEAGKIVYSLHQFNDFSDFNYLKNYPQKYFSNYIAMELENSLKDQLKAIDYTLSIINS